MAQDSSNDLTKNIEIYTQNLKVSLRDYFSTYRDNLLEKKYKNLTALYRQIQASTNVGVSTLQDFFNGKSIMTVESIIKLAMFFKINLQDIFSAHMLPDFYPDNDNKPNKNFYLSKLLHTKFEFNDEEINDILKYIEYIEKSKNNNLNK